MYISSKENCQRHKHNPSIFYGSLAGCFAVAPNSLALGPATQFVRSKRGRLPFQVVTSVPRRVQKSVRFGSIIIAHGGGRRGVHYTPCTGACASCCPPRTTARGCSAAAVDGGGGDVADAALGKVGRRPALCFRQRHGHRVSSAPGRGPPPFVCSDPHGT